MRHPLFCLVSFINTSWDSVNQSRELRVPYLHSTNWHVLSFYTFPWHHGQTPCPPVPCPSRKQTFHLLLLLASSAWVDWSTPFSTSSLLLALNWSTGICPEEISWGAFCCFQLSLPMVLIGNWIPKVQWSFNSVGGGKKCNQAKLVLWSWMSQGQFVQITWPFVPEATQLGNWAKRTISLQIKCSISAELSWTTELQWLKQQNWAQNLIKTWVRCVVV